MIIAATGTTGSIGHFLPVLEPGIRPLEIRLEVSEAEMISAAKSTDASALIHMAAMTSVSACEKDPARAREINVAGAVKLLRAAQRAGVKRFVQVSTSHVFRATSEPIELMPEQAGDAVAVYGRTKLEAELALSAAADDVGMELAIARVFSVIDPDMRPGFLFPELHRRARERDFSPLPGYANVRDFIQAREACEQVLKLAKVARLKHRIYHICTGHAQSVRELAVKVFAEYGIKETEMTAMFPAHSKDPLRESSNEKPNYMMSRPTAID